jgi:uncharacterized membrane protein
LTAYRWLLLFHLFGAFSLFAGAAVAGTLQLAALRRDRAREVLALLRPMRVAVALIGAGAAATLGFGIALAEHLGYGLAPAWIQAALGLWVAAMALGGAGGRTGRRARTLAEDLVAAGDDAPNAELHALLADRRALAANALSSAAVVAIVVLMVWRP